MGGRGQWVRGCIHIYMYYVVMAGNSESRENGWRWAAGKGCIHVHHYIVHGSQQYRGNVQGGWMTVGWGMYMAGNSTKNG